MYCVLGIYLKVWPRLERDVEIQNAKVKVVWEFAKPNLTTET
jgi:hypothetical protein